MRREAALPAHLSLYLDILRFGAAAVVFLGHFGTRRMSGGLLFRFEPLGPAAVDVFFVLSGFVIAHVAAGREGTAAEYAARRAARILSVVVPALVLTAGLDALGLAVNPDFYRMAPGLDVAHPLAGYPLSLVFLHETWTHAAQPGSNLPFWSLGFEVWYYVMFGVAWFARGQTRLAWLGLTLLVVGPKVLLLLPVWLCGVAAWRACAGPAPPRAMAWAMLLAPALFLLRPSWAMPGWEPYHPLDWADPMLPQLGLDWLVGGVVALHLVGVRFVGAALPSLPAGFARAVRWLAGCTFGLYLLHVPLMHCLAAILPWPPGSVASRLAVGLAAPLLALLLARRLEAGKAAWRRAIAPLFNRFAAPPAAR